MEQINEAILQRAGGARLEKKSGHGGWIALGVAAAVLAAGYLGLCAYATRSTTMTARKVPSGERSLTARSPFRTSRQKLTCPPW